MISLKTIAEECGVSVATVSKALNDQKDISDVTKRRIREIAEKLGYFPNAAARSLKTKQSYNIGVLFEEEVGSGLTHEYFSGVLNSFKVQAEKLGYDITFIILAHFEMMYFLNDTQNLHDSIPLTKFPGITVRKDFRTLYYDFHVII